MKALLDTNILIHREAATSVRKDIGRLFFWLDKLHYEKCIHPVTSEEIQKHKDPRVRSTFETKLQSYKVMRTSAAIPAEVQHLASEDRTENDRVDTTLVNELYARRVDILISEDRGVHEKAAKLGIADRTFTISAFLEKSVAENPELITYKLPTVRKVLFGNVDVKSEFFDSFREDYGGQAFNVWFNRKAEETAYVSYEEGELVAFLYVKPEGPEENYSDIEPRFVPKRRLKIGTFKVELNGYKLGERFLKIVFDNAISQRVDEIYVTIFRRTDEQNRLVEILREFGFVEFGIKDNSFGTEAVFVRDLTRRFDSHDPKKTFPFISKSSRSFLVPIYPEYHTSLLPDSILKTESPNDFVEQNPHRNAIRKVYVSRSLFKELKRGDTIVFYRTGGYYQGVATTLGIVDDVFTKIRDEAEFIKLCQKRSVFTLEELRAQWNFKTYSRPFVVGFLYAYSFPKRPNLKELIDNGIIKSIDSVPRGFEQINASQFSRILELAKADPRTFVD